MAGGQATLQGDLPSEILQALSKNEPLLSSDAFPTQKSADVKSALDRLSSRSMVTYDTIDREEAVLEPEAVEIEANGSHEARVFEALRTAVEGLTVSELEAAVGDRNVVKVGQGKAFKSKWITKGEGGRLVASVSRIPPSGDECLIAVDRFYTRYNPRTAPAHTKDTHASRSQGYYRSEEAEVGQDAKGNCLQNP